MLAVKNGINQRRFDFPFDLLTRAAVDDLVEKRLARQLARSRIQGDFDGWRDGEISFPDAGQRCAVAALSAARVTCDSR
jgi:hypothetical protein